MHVHILGICGTFMGGLAAIARAAGHRVTGSDRNVYPPMSTQLQQLGIDITQGFEAGQLSPPPDVVVVGNVMGRGMPVVEALLDSGIPFQSGPQWLAEQVLRGRHVLAVAGTHGKTTTSSLLAHVLEQAGLAPGFLIGGVPGNFEVSARLGEGRHFVIEADEYDTAFFDKRAKFVHYAPRTLLLNNLEYDHADIYPDLAAIQRQVHHVVRTVPASGRILCNAADANLAQTLAMGCWTPVEGFARTDAGVPAVWQAQVEPGGDFSRFTVVHEGHAVAQVQWSLLGAHNVDNALGAIAAAHAVGVPVATAAAALSSFKGVRRRMERIGDAAGVQVYDDFAHHPTAIATTIEGLRRRIGAARLVAVLEPRSNTMRLGVHRDSLAPSLQGADQVWLYAPRDLGWDASAVTAALPGKGHAVADLDDLLQQLAGSLQSGDHVLVMSNGGFGGLHRRLLAALAQRAT